MLMIKRKNGQSFVIGGNITVTISKITGNTVHVAIDAPREIPIVRSEIIKNKPDHGPVDASAAESGSEG